MSDHTHDVVPAEEYFVVDDDKLGPFRIYKRVPKTVGRGQAMRQIWVLQPYGASFIDAERAADYADAMNGKGVR